MENIIELAKAKVRQYPVELILIGSAVCAILISTLLYFQSKDQVLGANNGVENEETEIHPLPQAKVFKVDIAGSVNKPDVYEVTPSARLKDLLVLAGGLSEDADKDYFYRNINRAQPLTDQEKIYIPSKQEVYNGLFHENEHSIVVLGPTTSYAEKPSTGKININTAVLSELMELSGVGTTTANKIISNRPYKSVNDLVTKKVLSQTIFNKIQDSIEL